MLATHQITLFPKVIFYDDNYLEVMLELVIAQTCMRLCNSHDSLEGRNECRIMYSLLCALLVFYLDQELSLQCMGQTFIQCTCILGTYLGTYYANSSSGYQMCLNLNCFRVP